MLVVFMGQQEMRWFKKSTRKDPWDEVIPGPMDDIAAAHRIRDICRCAVASAEHVGGLAGRSDDEKTRVETDRYQRAARTAMEIAMKISDDLLRDAAIRQIVDLCVRANDLKTARILVRAVQAGSIKQALLNEYPALGQ
jgi:hypothetical protein